MIIKTLNLVNQYAEMALNLTMKTVMMEMMSTRMDALTIVKLRMVGVVLILQKLHLFVRNFYVETVLKKVRKVVMMEKHTQMQMIRSTVKMIVQDLLRGIDVTLNLRQNAKLVEMESKILLLLGLKKNATMEILRTTTAVPHVVCLKNHIVEMELLSKENTATMGIKLIVQTVSITVKLKLKDTIATQIQCSNILFVLKFVETE